MSLFLSIISVFLLISPTFIIIFGVKSLERLINQTYIQSLSFGNTEHRYLVPCYITNHYPVKKKMQQIIYLFNSILMMCVNVA